MTRFFAAFAFLTRVPIRRAFDASDVGRASLFFPLVGAAVGGLQLIVYTYLPVPALVRAVLVVVVSAWVTRALHLDGLADFVDGLAGGTSRQRALEIMRDPRVGAFGATALVLVVAAKIAAVHDLRSPLLLVAAPALARWSLVPLARLRYARESGTGKALSEHAGWLELAGATVLTGGLAWLVPWRAFLGAWAGVVLVTLVVAAIARSRLGGVTGDVLGANVELAEALALIAGTVVA